jgi:thiol-disulfide isomerase/thioredoxin
MRRYLNKNSISNLIFLIAIAALIYGPSRVWIMRQVAFPPSITDAENRESIASYDWLLAGVNSEDLNFNTLKGEVIVVNFWATWCPSCRAEKPMLNKLYQEFSNEVKFVTVSQENASVISAFNEEHDYVLPSYTMSSYPPEEFTKTNAIPSSFVIDRQGRIAVHKTGAARWNSDKMRRLLTTLVAEENTKM